MDFKRHPDLEGRHAFLSPSSPHWLNYNDQKLEARYHTARAARKGVDLHKLAHDSIKLGVKLARGNKALSTYVLHGIEFKMSCEQPLRYSDNCFGTADTISFRRNKLRIHDLKTGINATSFKQLEVYAALFCLEYDVNPLNIEIELRIYQRDQIKVFHPEPEAILTIMDKIIDFNRQIESIKEVHW